MAALELQRAALETRWPDGVGLNRRRFGPASGIVLLLPQGEDLDDNRPYFERLLAYARQQRIKLAYGGDIVVPDQRLAAGRPRPLIRSTAPIAPSTSSATPPEHEGFGDRGRLSTGSARRPLAVLEYPVFERFVRAHVPHYISLGDTEHLERMEEFGGLYRLRPDIVGLSRAAGRHRAHGSRPGAALDGRGLHRCAAPSAG